MILYTMMPQEEIFPPDEEAFKQQLHLPIEGGSLIVQRLDEGRYKVVQLISGNPSLYLHPQYSPGAIVDTNHLI
ncbi:YlzJ-like family protein [Alkalicoccobacillus porphyridii]|uniref:Uncharacterized protein n=1 Tax=Alkalicoccobacillus porphyridii TaxID=2597270 RepID=A0A553ZYE3_9BACI|nr:YlzJ-like family protein [Alkalicoccobacillus porphyridii]TSB46462.1 hypothetical protein FN960_11720 [Alkalicoccobacillus porphyridii]